MNDHIRGHRPQTPITLKKDGEGDASEVAGRSEEARGRDDEARGREEEMMAAAEGR